MALAQPSWLTALAALLGSILELGPAPPVLSTSTSLTLPPPPVWTALLVDLLMALALLCCQAALPAPVGSLLVFWHLQLELVSIAWVPWAVSLETIPVEWGHSPVVVMAVAAVA